MGQTGAKLELCVVQEGMEQQEEDVMGMEVELEVDKVGRGSRGVLGLPRAG